MSKSTGMKDSAKTSGATGDPEALDGMTDIIVIEDGDSAHALYGSSNSCEPVYVSRFFNDVDPVRDEKTVPEEQLDLIAVEDDDATADVVYGSSNSCEPVYTQGRYFNDVDPEFDESAPEKTPDVIVIEDDGASADVVYGSSNSCLPLQVGTGNDTITGKEEGPIDIIASGEMETDYDGVDLLDLTVGEDRDAHAAYGGSNSCEPYAGDNTCEPPAGSSSGGGGLLDLFITSFDVSGDADGRVDTLDIITTAAPEEDDDDLLELTIGADKDAHAAYGGSNSCEPYAGENTCEPPDDGGGDGGGGDGLGGTENFSFTFDKIDIWE